MKKKMLAVFLVLLMAVMLVPAAAFAAPLTTTPTYGTIDLRDPIGNTSGYGWTWDQTTKTLTLDGLNLIADNDIETDGFILQHGTKVILYGTNYVKAGDDAFYCEGNLTITGGGSLEIEADYGFCVEEGSVSIYGGNITVTSGYTGIDSWYDINIYGGTLTLNCGWEGISAGEDVEISGGTIKINSDSYGIYNLDGDIVISGGSVDIVSSDYGIYADNAVYFKGGNTSILRNFDPEYENGVVAYVSSDYIYFGNRMIVLNGVNDGWDDDDGNYDTLVMAGNGPVIIKSIFSEITSIPVGGDTRYMPFADVQPGAWYYEDVYYCYDNGIMNGVETYRFGPEEPITRGMIVAILWRNEGSPYASGKSFKDVAEGMYYSEAVKWAISKGIITGYGDGTFRPDEEVSLEELGAIMFRYAAHKNLDTTARGGLSVYADSDEIGQWAKSAMSWAEAYGMIDGIVGGRLKPAGAATRAQAAAMLARLPKAEEPNGIIMAQFTGGYDGGMTEPPYDVPLG